MKLYICQGCDDIFRSDLDVQDHSKNSAHEEYREYDEEFLTRFLAQA